MTVAAVDIDTSFGTDIACSDDVSPVWGLASDDENLVLVIYRKVTTPPGALDEIDDPAFDSLDLRSYVNAKMTRAAASNLQSRLSSVCENDPRVKHCSAKVTFTFATMTMLVELQLLTTQGPFDLVLSATQVTVEILSIAGQPAPAPDDTVAAPPAVIAIKGEPGAPGAPGAAGSAGTPQGMLNFGGDGLPRDVASGAEEVMWQGLIRFGDLPGSLTATMSAEVSSASGTSTFRLRVGGGDMSADGSIAATFTSASAAYEIKTASAAFVNPTGTLRVKITAENAVVDQAASGKTAEVTFR